MITACVGWEVATFQNSKVQAIYGPMATTLTMVAYQLDLGARQNKPPPLFGSSPIADILFQALWLPAMPGGWAGGTEEADYQLRQISGTNAPAQAASPAFDDCFCASILKMWVPQAVNKSLIKENLSILVPQGSFLILQAAHSGFQADFEVQGVLFFQ